MNQRTLALLFALLIGLEIAVLLLILGPVVGQNQFAKGGIVGFVVVANVFLFNRVQQKLVGPARAAASDENP